MKYMGSIRDLPVSAIVAAYLPHGGRSVAGEGLVTGTLRRSW